MEMLMDYHLVFIMVSIIFFLVAIFMILESGKNKEWVMFAVIICGINSVLCTICYLGFFGIGVLTVQNNAFEVESYIAMYPVFGFFWLLYWINIVLIYYCYYKWMHDPLNADISEE